MLEVGKQRHPRIYNIYATMRRSVPQSSHTSQLATAAPLKKYYTIELRIPIPESDQAAKKATLKLHSQTCVRRNFYWFESNLIFGKLSRISSWFRSFFREGWFESTHDSTAFAESLFESAQDSKTFKESWFESAHESESWFESARDSTLFGNCIHIMCIENKGSEKIGVGTHESP